MPMDKKLIAIALVVVAAVLLLSSQGALSGNLLAGEAVQSKAIVVAYLPVTQSLPLFTAFEQGAFEKAGLRVELARFDSPNQLIDAVASGRAQATAPSAASGIAALAEQKSPGSFKIYGFNCGTRTNVNDELLAAKNSTVASIAGLKGGKLGIIPGIQFRTVALKILKENGLKPGDVELVDIAVPLQLQALATGSVDALLTLEPVGTIGTKKGVSRMLEASPMVKFIADPWCGGVGLVSTKFYAQDRANAELFIKTMREAAREVEANASTKTYLEKYLGMDAETAATAPLPLFVDTARMNDATAAAYQKFADVFFEMNVTTERPLTAGMLLRS